jgi:peptidoglycan/LPS O-acetylase OafA/YrhL
VMCCSQHITLMLVLQFNFEINIFKSIKNLASSFGESLAEMTASMLQILHPKYRPDIDGLRAVAVLAVVSFHAFPSLLSGGFIGVDVFFVISGYLISTIIFENLDKNTFSFTDFYVRRIKRIFPALILVLVASYVFGWLVLTADEYKQLGKHIAAGAGFTSNLILWSEAGYFDNSAETKPLLNLWSLSIEEQFYIVWPFVLWLSWRLRVNVIFITVTVACVSFYLNIKGVKNDQIGVFYSPLTRFWELLSGSLLAWYSINKINFFSKSDSTIYILFSKLFYKNYQKNKKFLSNFTAFIGFIFLTYGFLSINKNTSFPGFWAIIPVMGAIFVILAGPKAWINHKILSSRIFVWFGLISYPLYLWHWPLLAFARIISGDIPSSSIRILVIFLSIVLAWLTYALIERPIRFGKGGKIKVLALIVIIAIVGYTGYNAYDRDGLKFRKVERLHGFTKHLDWQIPDTEGCSKKFNIFPCQISKESVRLMIIGDSHAGHLYPGLVKIVRDDIGIFTGGTCTPLRDVKMYVNNNQASHPCATNDYISKNLNSLDANPTVDIIILSSFWRPALTGQFLNQKERSFWGGIRLISNLPDEANLPSDELVYRGLKRTIGDLLVRKKEVILVRDTPDFEKDIRDECLKRFSITASFDCKLPRSTFDNQRVKENQLINKLVSDFPELKVYDPFDILCNYSVCHLVKNGMPLYRDQHHLSVYGSYLVGSSIVEKYLPDLKR